MLRCKHDSVSPDSMGLSGPVDAVDKLCGHEVAQVLHAVRGGVYVVVATFSVVAEAVCVLHTQVQTLDTRQTNIQNHYRAAHFANALLIGAKTTNWSYLIEMRVCLLYLQGLWIPALTGR